MLTKIERGKGRHFQETDLTHMNTFHVITLQGFKAEQRIIISLTITKLQTPKWKRHMRSYYVVCVSEWTSGLKWS